VEAIDGAPIHGDFRKARRRRLSRFLPDPAWCHTQSETIEEGVQNIREAIELHVESLVQDGLPIPNEDILIKPIEIAV
jgi:predicted RNase H-like HicB family nuclease